MLRIKLIWQAEVVQAEDIVHLMALQGLLLIAVILITAVVIQIVAVGEGEVLEAEAPQEAGRFRSSKAVISQVAYIVSAFY